MITQQVTNWKPVDLGRYASVFAAQEKTGLSERYGFIDTMRPVKVFEDAGWFPAKVDEQRCNLPGRVGYQKHMIRFRQADASLVVGQTIPEIVMTNAHDGTAAFILLAGFFEVRCANGLTVARETIQEMRVRHIGYTDESVRAALEYVLEAIPRVQDRVEEFKAIEMTPDEQGAFAMKALEEKYRGLPTDREFDFQRLVRPIRHAEQQERPTIWRTLNTVQEKVIRGGLMSYTQEVEVERYGRTYNTTKRRRARGITSIDENVRVNQALWGMASFVADVKMGRVKIDPVASLAPSVDINNLPAVIAENFNV